MAERGKTDTERDEQRVEEMVRELTNRLREMEHGRDLTDYAISLLKESAEEAGQAEQARESVAKATGGDAFNPIAFGIPLVIIGVVLCATGILIGPGLGVLAIAFLMMAWGLLVPLISRRKGEHG